MEYEKRREENQMHAINIHLQKRLRKQPHDFKRAAMDIQQSAHTEKPSSSLDYATGCTVLKHECCRMCAFKLKVRQD